jgi:hypothetical protein
MKIIWADHDPSWGISSSKASEGILENEETNAEMELAREFSTKETIEEEEEVEQEKSPEKGAKGFG